VVDLIFREVERLAQRGFGGVAVFGVLNGFDDAVDVVECGQPALKDVGAILGLAEFVLGATADDIPAVIDVVVERLTKIEYLRRAVDEREIDDAEGRFEVAFE